MDWKPVILDDLDRQPLQVPPGCYLESFVPIEPPRPFARRGARAKSALVTFRPCELPPPPGPDVYEE